MFVSGFGQRALFTATCILFTSSVAGAQEAAPQPAAQPGASAESQQQTAPAPKAEKKAPAKEKTATQQPQGPVAPAKATQHGATSNVEELVVTGSRIRTNRLDQPAPVVSLSSSDIAQTGLTSIGDILQRLPSAGGSINSRFNQSGNAGFAPDGSGTSAGSAEIDLRYLTAKRTLVLVDGLRWVPGAAASGVPAASDLNTIPVALIDRIEVLQDGASSIYGSDAIGGVVNIITKKNMDGAQANAYVGGYQQGDGAAQQYDLVWGNGTERASIVVGATYVKQSVVWSKDRDLSSVDVPGVGVCIGGYCSSATPRGRFDFYDPTLNDYVDLTLKEGVDPTQVVYDPGNADASSFEAFTPGDRFDFQPYNMLLTPSQRMGAFSQVDYRISENVRFNGKLLFNNRSSKNQAAPEPLFLGTDAGTHTRTDRIVIDETNPYNPLGFTLDGSSTWFIGRRAVEAGPRIFEQTVNTWYGSGGVTGSFELANRGFTWDATMIYSENRAEQVKTNGINAARLEKGLGPISVCEADPECVPINVFGGPGSLTPEMVNYLTYEQHDLSSQRLWDFVANVSGDLFRLPGGNVGIAAGVEHRDLSGSFRPDAIVAAGDTGDVPAQPTSGSYNVNEAYLEALVPIVSNKPGFELLDVTGAVRLSDYSTFGTQSTFKAGLRWRPFADLLLRGTMAQGFRAPSIGELYGSAGRYDASIEDPCNHPETLPPAVAANCRGLGVPDGYEQNNTQISVTTGGNADLKPETSLGWNASLVYSPSFIAESGVLDRVDLEVGWYRIRLTDAVTTDPQVYLSQCIATMDPAFCQGIDRSDSGQIINFNNRLRNIGGITTSGIDVALALTSPKFGFGRLRLDWLGTYLIEYTEDYPASTGLKAIERVGTELGDPQRGYPAFKSTAILTWVKDTVGASLAFRYVDSITERCENLDDYGLCSAQDLAQNDLGPVLYNDVQFSWVPSTLDSKLSVAVGINNLFDVDPPVCQSCALNNYDPSLFDVPGRFGFVRAGYKL